MCLEGEISRQSILNSLSRGKKASGDLIPWTVSEQVMHFLWCVCASAAGCVGACIVKLRLVSPHSSKIQTSVAFLVEELFALLFTRIIKG